MPPVPHDHDDHGGQACNCTCLPLPPSLLTLDLSDIHPDGFGNGLGGMEKEIFNHPTLTELHLPHLDSIHALTQLPPNLHILSFRRLHASTRNDDDRYDDDGEKQNDVKQRDVSTTSHLASLWPPTLTSLKLPFAFNHPLTLLHLPPSLIELELSGSFNQPLDGLPNNLQRLTLKCDRVHHHHPILLDSAIHSHHLPASLLELHLHLSVNSHTLQLPADIQLPSHLHTLTELGRFMTSIEALPHILSHPHLTHLTLHESPNQPITQLPSRLKKLEFQTGFYSEMNQPLNDVTWPHTLETLILPHGWNQPVDRLNLPDSLTEVTTYIFDTHT